MLRDIKSNEALLQSLPPAARTTGTATGSAADLRQTRGAVAEFSFGDWTDGTHTPSVEDSPDGTTYTAVPSSNLQGTLAAISGTAGENTLQRVGYIGPGAYLRTKIVSGTSTTGVEAAANIRTDKLVSP